MKAGLPFLALTLCLAACAPEAKAPPAVVAATAPVTVVEVRRPPALPSAPTPWNWWDAPLSPGRWEYSNQPDGTVALFGRGEASGMTITCIPASRTVTLMLFADAPGPRLVRVRTETGERSFTAPAQSAFGGYVVSIALAANDPLLDAIALSKGRFAVEGEGLAPLYLPSWAEVTRVIEDCR